jgi:4'-phosphopantetheinyl transferase
MCAIKKTQVPTISSVCNVMTGDRSDNSGFFSGVQVWTAWLDSEPERLKAFWLTLSKRERLRAMRFTFERERHRFVTARGFLRCILCQLLDTEPNTLEFNYGPAGKPSLGGALAHSGVEFSVAHSDNLALFALSCSGAVGVDVEEIRPMPDLDGLIERCFSASESAEVHQLSGPPKIKAFFRIWTRKEARLKATGEGIAGLTKLMDDQASAPGAPYSLYDFIPAPGYSGALAVLQPA